MGSAPFLPYDLVSYPLLNFSISLKEMLQNVFPRWGPANKSYYFNESINTSVSAPSLPCLSAFWHGMHNHVVAEHFPFYANRRTKPVRTSSTALFIMREIMPACQNDTDFCHFDKKTRADKRNMLKLLR